MTQNYRNVMLLAICIAIALIVAPAMAVGPRDQMENRPGQIVPYDPVASLSSTYNFQVGAVIFRPRAGGSELDPWVFVSNDNIQNLTPLDPAFYMDGTGGEPSFNQSQYLAIKIQPDGENTLADGQLIPGNYTGHIRFGNGNQPETVHFTISRQTITYVPYLGSAKPTVITPAIIAPKLPKITDIIAMYGYSPLLGIGIDGKPSRGQHWTADVVKMPALSNTNTLSPTSSLSDGPDWAWLDTFKINDPASGDPKGIDLVFLSNGKLHGLNIPDVYKSVSYGDGSYNAGTGTITLN